VTFTGPIVPGAEASVPFTVTADEDQATDEVDHPNVVTVYDVGSFEGQVFIAMELVDGPTLARWRDARSRTRREVIDIFVAAVPDSAISGTSCRQPC